VCRAREVVLTRGRAVAAGANPKVRQADWAVGEAGFRREQYHGEARPLPRRHGRPLLGRRRGPSVPFSAEVPLSKEDI
jgi:hypothetical protein